MLDIRAGIDVAKSFENKPPLFSDKEIEDWKSGGTPIPWGGGAVPLPRSDPRGGQISGVPLPISDPRPRLNLPPVQDMDGASVVQNLDQSAVAASAGKNTGASWTSSLSAELETAKAMTLAAVQDMIKMLNFSVSPTISPKINMPAQPGGQAAPGKQSAADTLKHNRHAAFADGLNFGSFA